MNTVIFDMDGLLIDSERMIHNAMIYAGEKMGLDDASGTSLRCLGVTSAGTKAIFREKYGEDFDFALCDRYKHEYLDKILPEKYFPPKPYAKDTITGLTEKGFRIALASSTRRGWVEPQLEYIGVLEYFTLLVCGDAVTKSKPDPEIFLTAAKKMDVSPKDCFVLEDSYNGIRAAHAAGMIPIMVPDLVAPNDEMIGLAAYIADDLSDAERYILNNS